jgi:hypothetical protein
MNVSWLFFIMVLEHLARSAARQIKPLQEDDPALDPRPHVDPGRSASDPIKVAWVYGVDALAPGHVEKHTFWQKMASERA